MGEKSRELIILNCNIKTRMIMDGAGGQVIDGGQSFDLCNFSYPFSNFIIAKNGKIKYSKLLKLTIEGKFEY